MFTHLCVFCGSHPGNRTEYRGAARALGQALASRSITLVYGGGLRGVMGALADAVLKNGGAVLGVIPDHLKIDGVFHPGLTELTVVSSMHERKALMARRADGFVALPGGLGTLEELFEALTWAQLGLHRKPCGVFNVGGYFDGLLRFLEHGVTEGFLAASHRDLLLDDTEPARLLDRLAAFEAPAVDKYPELADARRLDGEDRR